MPDLGFNEGNLYGRGKRAKVYEHDANDSRLVKKYEHQVHEKELKAYFYLQKIIYILFPDFTNQVYAAKSNQNGSYVLTVKKEKLDANTDLIRRDLLDQYNNFSSQRHKVSSTEKKVLSQVRQTHGYQEFKSFLDDLDIKIDEYGRNFSVDQKKEKAIYLDSVLFPYWFGLGRVTLDYYKEILFRHINQAAISANKKKMLLNILEQMFELLYEVSED